jgi:hypothetical protein
MFVCCECCVLSGRGFCDRLIIRPEESYRLWRVVVCDQETSKTRRLKAANGLWKIQPKRVVTPGKQTNKHHILALPTVQNKMYKADSVSSVFHLRYSSTKLDYIYYCDSKINFQSYGTQ